VDPLPHIKKGHLLVGQVINFTILEGRLLVQYQKRSGMIFTHKPLASGSLLRFILLVAFDCVSVRFTLSGKIPPLLFAVGVIGVMYYQPELIFNARINPISDLALVFI
jgi:hypothetical protein